MNETPVTGLVSTIIPVFNRRELLCEAVASVLGQTWPAIEVIIIDDGSTDETATECDRLAEAHPAVRTIHLPHRGRIGLAREVGRRAARGEFIQYLDSDDLLAPTKFQTMVEALRQHPECDIAYCFTRRYRRGEPPIEVATERTGQTFNRLLPGLVGRRAWHTSTPLYRRTLTDRVGAWSDLRFWEDLEYDLRVALCAPRTWHCREFLTDFRDHGGQRASELDIYAGIERLEDAPEAAARMLAGLRDHGYTGTDPDVARLVEDLALIGEYGRRLGFDDVAARATEVLAGARTDDPAIADVTVAFAAEIAPIHPRVAVHPGERFALDVRVWNRSTVAFKAGDFGVELVARIRKDAGVIVPGAAADHQFVDPLAPGDSCQVTLTLVAPSEPGRYDIDLGLLWNGTEWLSPAQVPSRTVELACGTEAVPPRWTLATSVGATGHLMAVDESPGAARVEVTSSPDRVSWHVQANLALGAVSRGDAITIRLRGRATEPRAIGAGVAMAHAPWENLGCYQELPLTTDWQEFAVAFLADRDDELARFHLDMGTAPGAIEVRDVTISGPERVPATLGPRRRPAVPEARRRLGILMYHAVVDTPLPVPDWCFLAAGEFRRQLEVVRSIADVVPLDAVRDGALDMPGDRPLVAITFDDGFMNTGTIALPHLEALEMPATVYLTTGLLGTRDTPWFSRLHHALSRTERRRITWGGQRLELDGPSDRERASRTLQARLKSLPGPQLASEVRRLVAQLGIDPDLPIAPDSPHAMLDRAMLEGMLATGLITFGAHTVTHPILGLLPIEAQRREIADSLAGVGAITGHPTRHFAFPNGRYRDYSGETLAILAAHGVEVCVTAEEGLNTSDTSPLELYRHRIGSLAPCDDFARFLHDLDGGA